MLAQSSKLKIYSQHVNSKFRIRGLGIFQQIADHIPLDCTYVVRKARLFCITVGTIANEKYLPQIVHALAIVD